MGVPHQGNMAFVPYARGYGYPYAGYNYGAAYGAGYPYGYGPYGPSLEEVKKVREAEEKAFKEAEDRAKELMEAEKKQYEEFCEAQKKAVDDAAPTRRSVSWQSSWEPLPSHMDTQDTAMVDMVDTATQPTEQDMATPMVDTAMAASTKRYQRRMQDGARATCF